MNVVSSIYCENRDKTYAVQILWICVLPLIVLFTRSVAADCTIRQHNGTAADHIQREQNFLDRLGPLKGHRLHVNDGNYNYTLGICISAEENAKDGVGLIQYTSNSQNFSLGRYDDVGLMGGHNWLVLTYYNGTNYTSHCGNMPRTSHIMVICDPTVFESKLRILEERRTGDPSGCFYLFEISSNVTCADNGEPKPKDVEPPHSLSSGSVFCIIFFTVAGIYLLLGFLYQRIVVGSKGLEQIPNYGFWRSFGNLQADGCDYICRCGPRQESHAYRGIDDRIRTDEERDDQLLNM